MRRLIMLGLLALGGTAMATEEPDYRVIAEYGDFEVRHYAPYLVAETEVTGEFDEVGSTAFGVLFDYIDGGNASRRDIAMTAPVSPQPAEGEKIEMTAPVTQARRDDAPDTYAVRFVMPAEYTMDTLPRPDDPRVELRPVQARTMAAIRYSGTWSERRYREHLETLRAALEREGLQVTGEPVWARYNAPFTPWFLRRNEILIPVHVPG